eukprot:2350666-Prymnesium_polylepis.1
MTSGTAGQAARGRGRRLQQAALAESRRVGTGCRKRTSLISSRKMSLRCSGRAIRQVVECHRQRLVQRPTGRGVWHRRQRPTGRRARHRLRPTGRWPPCGQTAIRSRARTPGGPHSGPRRQG